MAREPYRTSNRLSSKKDTPAIQPPCRREVVSVDLQTDPDEVSAGSATPLLHGHDKTKGGGLKPAEAKETRGEKKRDAFG